MSPNAHQWNRRRFGPLSKHPCDQDACENANKAKYNGGACGMLRDIQPISPALLRKVRPPECTDHRHRNYDQANPLFERPNEC